MVQSFNFNALKGIGLAIMRPSLLKPSQVTTDIRAIDYWKLRQSFQGIIFDKDNTLTAPYAEDLHPEFKQSWKVALESFGDKILIVSNSAGSSDDKQRQFRTVEHNLGVPVFQSPQKKPFGGQDAINRLGLNGHEVVVVGDRILTDIVYGNLIGAHTILCTKIITEVGDNYFAKHIRRIEQLLLRLFMGNSDRNF